MVQVFEKTSFDPETVSVMVDAYDRALLALGLADRKDMTALLVACQIIHIAGKGERDPLRLLDATLVALRDISTAPLVFGKGRALRP